MKGDVAILIPTLGRPHQIAPLLESIYTNTKRPTVLFLTTESDKETRAEIQRHGAWMQDVPKSRRADYQRKINLGAKIVEEDLMFMGATDLKFHPDWLEEAKAVMHWKIDVVGTNDLGNPRVLKGQHSTHSLFTRNYLYRFGIVDEPGKILCEDYWHEYCDDEFVQTAIARKRYKFARKSIVEHLHPLWDKEDWDDTYKMTNRRVADGYQIFIKRQQLWTR